MVERRYPSTDLFRYVLNFSGLLYFQSMCCLIISGLLIFSFGGCNSINLLSILLKVMAAHLVLAATLLEAMGRSDNSDILNIFRLLERMVMFCFLVGVIFGSKSSAFPFIMGGLIVELIQVLDIIPFSMAISIIFTNGVLAVLLSLRAGYSKHFNNLNKSMARVLLLIYLLAQILELVPNLMIFSFLRVWTVAAVVCLVEPKSTRRGVHLKPEEVEKMRIRGENRDAYVDTYQEVENNDI